MLPKGAWGSAVPTRSLPCLLLQDPAQKQAQVDPRWDVCPAEQAGGAVSFQPSPALTPTPPPHHIPLVRDPALPPPAQGMGPLSTPGREARCPEDLSPSHSDLSSNSLALLPSALFGGLARLQQL